MADWASRSHSQKLAVKYLKEEFESKKVPKLKNGNISVDVAEGLLKNVVLTLNHKHIRPTLDVGEDAKVAAERGISKRELVAKFDQVKARISEWNIFEDIRIRGEAKEVLFEGDIQLLMSGWMFGTSKKDRCIRVYMDRIESGRFERGNFVQKEDSPYELCGPQKGGQIHLVPNASRNMVEIFLGYGEAEEKTTKKLNCKLSKLQDSERQKFFEVLENLQKLHGERPNLRRKSTPVIRPPVPPPHPQQGDIVTYTHGHSEFTGEVLEVKGEKVRIQHPEDAVEEGGERIGFIDMGMITSIVEKDFPPPAPVPVPAPVPDPDPVPAPVPAPVPDPDPVAKGGGAEGEAASEKSTAPPPLPPPLPPPPVNQDEPPPVPAPVPPIIDWTGKWDALKQRVERFKEDALRKKSENPGELMQGGISKNAGDDMEEAKAPPRPSLLQQRSMVIGDRIKKNFGERRGRWNVADQQDDIPLQEADAESSNVVKSVIMMIQHSSSQVDSLERRAAFLRGHFAIEVANRKPNAKMDQPVLQIGPKGEVMQEFGQVQDAVEAVKQTFQESSSEEFPSAEEAVQAAQQTFQKGPTKVQLQTIRSICNRDSKSSDLGLDFDLIWKYDASLSGDEIVEFANFVQTNLKHAKLPEESKISDALEKIKEAVTSGGLNYDPHKNGEDFRLLKLYKELHKLADEVHRHVQPLNLEKLIRLVQETEENSAKLQDKDIVLLVGGTGAGKSTTALLLSGLKMHQYQDGSGAPHIDAAKPEYLSSADEKALQERLLKVMEEFKSSNRSGSVTRVINAADIEFEGNTFTICDTPGFNDTAGAEQDIANGICIVRALKKARSIRPVLLLSEKDLGSRSFQNIDAMADPVLDMVSEKHHGNVAFLFSRVGNRTKEDLIDSLEGKVESMRDEQKEPKYIQFAEALLSNLEGSPNDAESFADIVHPLECKRDDLVRRLLRMVPIEEKRAFKEFTTDSSTKKLHEQLYERNMKFIEAALPPPPQSGGNFDLSNFHVQVVMSKLGQIKRLGDSLNLPRAKACYISMIKKIGSGLKFRFQDFEGKLKGCKTASTFNDLKSNLQRTLESLSVLVEMRPVWEEHLWEPEEEHKESVDEYTVDFGENAIMATKGFVEEYHQKLITAEKELKDCQCTGSSTESSREALVKTALRSFMHLNASTSVFWNEFEDKEQREALLDVYKSSQDAINRIYFASVEMFMDAFAKKDIKQWLLSGKEILRMLEDYDNPENQILKFFDWRKAYERVCAVMCDIITSDCEQFVAQMQVTEGLMQGDAVQFCEKLFGWVANLTDRASESKNHFTDGVDAWFSMLSKSVKEYCRAVDKNINSFVKSPDPKNYATRMELLRSLSSLANKAVRLAKDHACLKETFHRAHSSVQKLLHATLSGAEKRCMQFPSSMNSLGAFKSEEDQKASYEEVSRALQLLYSAHIAAQNDDAQTSPYCAEWSTLTDVVKSTLTFARESLESHVALSFQEDVLENLIQNMAVREHASSLLDYAICEASDVEGVLKKYDGAVVDELARFKKCFVAETADQWQVTHGANFILQISINFERMQEYTDAVAQARDACLKFTEESCASLEKELQEQCAVIERFPQSQDETQMYISKVPPTTKAFIERIDKLKVLISKGGEVTRSMANMLGGEKNAMKSSELFKATKKYAVSLPEHLIDNVTKTANHCLRELQDNSKDLTARNVDELELTRSIATSLTHLDKLWSGDGWHNKFQHIVEQCRKELDSRNQEIKDKLRSLIQDCDYEALGDKIEELMAAGPMPKEAKDLLADEQPKLKDKIKEHKADIKSLLSNDRSLGDLRDICEPYHRLSTIQNRLLNSDKVTVFFSPLVSDLTSEYLEEQEKNVTTFIDDQIAGIEVLTISSNAALQISDFRLLRAEKQMQKARNNVQEVATVVLEQQPSVRGDLAQKLKEKEDEIDKALVRIEGPEVDIVEGWGANLRDEFGKGEQISRGIISVDEAQRLLEVLFRASSHDEGEEEETKEKRRNKIRSALEEEEEKTSKNPGVDIKAFETVVEKVRALASLDNLKRWLEKFPYDRTIYQLQRIQDEGDLTEERKTRYSRVSRNYEDNLKRLPMQQIEAANAQVQQDEDIEPIIMNFLLDFLPTIIEKLPDLGGKIKTQKEELSKFQKNYNERNKQRQKQIEESRTRGKSQISGGGGSGGTTQGQIKKQMTEDYQHWAKELSTARKLSTKVDAIMSFKAYHTECCKGFFENCFSNVRKFDYKDHLHQILWWLPAFYEGYLCFIDAWEKLGKSTRETLMLHVKDRERPPGRVSNHAASSFESKKIDIRLGPTTREFMNAFSKTLSEAISYLDSEVDLDFWKARTSPGGGLDLYFSMLAPGLVNVPLPDFVDQDPSRPSKPTLSFRQIARDRIAEICQKLEDFHNKREGLFGSKEYTLDIWTKIRDLDEEYREMIKAVDILSQQDSYLEVAMSEENNAQPKQAGVFGLTAAITSITSAVSGSRKQVSPELLKLRKILQILENVQTVEDQIKDVISTMGETLNKKFLSEPKLQTPNINDKDEFFEELWRDFTAINESSSLFGLNNDPGSVLEKELDSVKGSIIDKTSTGFPYELPPANEATQKDSEALRKHNKPYYDIDRELDIFKSFAAKFDGHPALKERAERHYGTIVDSLGRMMRSFKGDTQREVKANMSRENLEKMYSILVSNLMRLQNVCLVTKAEIQDTSRSSIDELLKDLKKEVVQDGNGPKLEGHELLYELNLRLQKTGNPLAKKICDSQEVFTDIRTELFNNKTSNMSFENALEEIKQGDERGGDIEFTEQQKQILMHWHGQYEREFLDHLHQCHDAVANADQKKKLIVCKEHKRQISRSAERIGDQLNSKKTNKGEGLVSLIALVSAYWTIDNSGMFPRNQEDTGSASKGKPMKLDALRKIHPVQILGIFRILGLDELDQKNSPIIKLDRHLVEIRTGEGKSVTLAITSIVLALINFDVSVACFSEYLSARDRDDFATLFDAFGTSRAIKYGTFQQVCERLVNKEFNIRETVKNFVKTGNLVKIGAGYDDDRDTVLLIDEVDVFFEEDFYGSVYSPFATVKSEYVNRLVGLLWSHWSTSKTIPSMKAILGSNEYRQCQEHDFKGYPELLEEALKTMQQDLRGLDQHSSLYMVKSGKIAYSEQDGYSFSISYGFKTVFAYFKEHANGNITERMRDSMTYIKIDCGVFSYAEIPNQFQHVMGVTGTLKTLSQPEKNLLRRDRDEKGYAMKKSTYIPSVYGKPNFQFAGNDPNDVKLVSGAEHNWFLEIQKEMMKRQTPPRGSNGVDRPVLIFFKETETLERFYNDDARVITSQKARIIQLTEKTQKESRAGLIEQAVSQGAMTIANRKFGRGTDFKCLDELINTSGGVHVIQTFVSEKLSEEQQIMGRTSRQGDHGSFSMVLRAEHLESFGIEEHDVKEMEKSNKLYESIDPKRQATFDNSYTRTTEGVIDMLEEHRCALEFLGSIQQGSRHSGGPAGTSATEAVKAYLHGRNEGPPVDEEPARTIILMDATFSMSNLIESAKSTVSSMFKFTHRTLEENGQSSSFEMQMGVYRNYNASTIEKIFQHSSWETKPDNLRQWVSGIGVDGGWGSEAVEIALSHVVGENDNAPIGMVVLIGDAPGQTHEETDSKRANRTRHGHNWENTEYSSPVYFDEELEKVRDLGIKVHTVYLAERAKENFEAIADETGGQCIQLDVDAQDARDTLRNVVCTALLDQCASGDKQMHARLMSSYKRITGGSGKGYISFND